MEGLLSQRFSKQHEDAVSNPRHWDEHQQDADHHGEDLEAAEVTETHAGGHVALSILYWDQVELEYKARTSSVETEREERPNIVPATCPAYQQAQPGQNCRSSHTF